MERLAAGERLVGDGAMGTQLLAHGLAPGEPPEAITLSRPALLEEIARAYREAGADLLETNTFGGSPLKLALHGLERQTETVNRAAVEAARRAAGDRAYVVGACGPSGRLLEPYGDTSPGAMYDSFRRQVAALIAAGVDGVCVETMTDLAEAVLAVRAARTAAPELPVMATMTFERSRRGFFTVMGTTIEQAARGLADAGAHLVGSNCGNGSAVMVEIAREFRAHTTLPVAIQPNAGLPEMRGGTAFYPEGPAEMAESARALLVAGVAVIGGCCGTTPEHVRALRAVVDARAE